MKHSIQRNKMKSPGVAALGLFYAVYVRWLNPFVLLLPVVTCPATCKYSS